MSAPEITDDIDAGTDDTIDDDALAVPLVAVPARPPAAIAAGTDPDDDVDLDAGPPVAVRYTGQVPLVVGHVGEWAPDEVRSMPGWLADRLTVRDDFQLDAEATDDDGDSDTSGTQQPAVGDDLDGSDDTVTSDDEQPVNDPAPPYVF